MLVAMPLRFAESDTVDDAGVVEFVTDDCVLIGEQRFEKSAIGVKGARIKDRVFGAEEFRQRALQFLVNVLGATNKAYAGHAEAVRVESFLRRSDQGRVIGKAEIIVGAHVQYAFSVGDGDVCVLRRGNHAFGLVEPLGANFFERAGELLIKFGEHDWPQTMQTSADWKNQLEPRNSGSEEKRAIRSSNIG